jgi:ribonuclease J
LTSVTLFAGERSIGGTQIVVESEGARLLFDIGLPFNPAANPFAGVKRRTGRELADLIELGEAPYLPGIYRTAHLDGVGIGSLIPPTDGPVAVALSHSHLDHSHAVGFVDERVPVYASPATARILPVLSETGASLGCLSRPIETVEPGESFQVGPMRVRMLPVDHDVAGASGMIIDAPDGVIAYSGDIRLHGLHPERSLAFAQAAREAGAKLLILEGTRLFPPPEEGKPPLPPERFEADVAPRVKQILESTTGLGIITLTPENGERVENIVRAAPDTGRQLVLTADALAFTLAALGRLPDTPVAVYLPDGEPAPVPPVVQQALEAAPRIVTPREIAASPGSYLLRLPLERFADLLDLNPGGGVLITSNGPPLGPFDPGFATMLWWAERMGMRVEDASSTGHAHAHDLASIAAHSGAPTVMSIHSRYPELLNVAPERLLLPERGRRYDLASL